MSFKNSEFWNGMSQCFECVKLVEHLLYEQKKKVEWCNNRGRPVPNSVRYDIARMEHALGEKPFPPRIKDYFDFNKEEIGGLKNETLD